MRVRLAFMLLKQQNQSLLLHGALTRGPQETQIRVRLGRSGLQAGVGVAGPVTLAS